jgi:calcineurin-like phosphoesterase family protein
MTVFFTSDTHFGHSNIIKYASRPFENVQEMDEALIERWNSVVGKHDTVYHLGDFCFGSAVEYLKRLNGMKYLLIGSHDSSIEKLDEGPRYKIVGRHVVYETPFPKSGHRIRVTLNHYAMRSWTMSHYGHWHLFGHHHGTLESYGMSFDIGVDCWGYKPVSLDKVYEKMKTLVPIVDYSEEK